MTQSGSRPAAEIAPVILGVATLVSGVATGLFSDLRLAGKIVGLAAILLWVVALGSLMWRLGRELPRHAQLVTFGAFALTAVLLIIALQTGPRLSSRTLVLSERGQEILAGACGDAIGAEVEARIALSQLDSPFVHVELDEPCDGDVRVRSEDLVAVLP
jgi:hypothetical protein